MSQRDVEPTHSGSTRRRFLLAIGIAEHDVNDVLADPWCQSATDQLLDVVQNAASALAEEVSP